MSNPTISFRLSPYHIARALKIMRKLEPNYAFSSPSQIIRDCFFDYLAKMTVVKNDQITNDDLQEITSKGSRNAITDIGDFADQLAASRKVVSQDKVLNTFLQNIEPSVKSSVKNFSPPDNWLEDDDTNTTKVE